MILATHGIIGSSIVQFTGLLDTYSGAAAAYSLRKLRTAYTGNAIRVRRTSDNTEQNIGFVNNVLDTASLTSFCSGTNGFVTTWYDQSGNGRDATQTTAANQPQIVSSGSVILENGKPAVQFDGSNDNLDANSLSSVFTGNDFLVSTANVYKNNGTLPTNSDRALWGFGNSTTIIPTFFAGASSRNGINPGGLIGGRSDSSTEIRAYGANVANQSLQQSHSSFENQSIYINGTLGDSVSVITGSVTLNNFSLGCLPRTTKSIFFNGSIQEIILYNSNESSNRTGIESNINSFYSIY
jgi:hypothetical protein